MNPKMSAIVLMLRPDRAVEVKIIRITPKMAAKRDKGRILSGTFMCKS